MQIPRALFLNAAVLTTILLLGHSIQTTLWYHWTAGAPAPLLWLNVVLYIVFTRSAMTAIFVAYGIALTATPFTAAPVGILWTSLLLTCSITAYARKRFFWASTIYFVAASSLFTILFQLSFALSSRWAGVEILSLSLFMRFAEVLLTAAFAAPQFWLLQLVDRWTLSEGQSEIHRPTSAGVDE